MTNTPQDIDFEELYQGATDVGDTMPWDIGRPQPVLTAVVEAGQVRGDVLDIGSGLGNNAIYLASQGFTVTGVDGSPAALAKARARASAAGVSVTFQQGDATKLEGLDDRFDTVIDSALYHCLTEEERHLYVAALHRVTRPGAGLHIFCFSDQAPAQIPGPSRISLENLRETVGLKWTIASIEPALYDTAETVESFLAKAKGFGAAVADRAEDFFKDIPRNDEGKIQMPMWHLTATRAS